ncbi:unnamed protein product [Blepharisma stoltei]|uniref:Serine/threonine-protein kinase PLK n=1 Tax=Blepharisma stoltei TaxID=1481888 RepID=A0AAU9IYV5_9CILI|nr:unnamed protein product [Blepharisma stoltei]
MSSRTRRISQDSQENQIIEERIVKVNGDVAIKSYTKGRFLGKGGFAKVYEFLSLDTKQVFAAKVIPKASLSKARARQKLMSEIKIHRSLHHTNIVRFEHFFEDDENVYILLELCANQTLNELMRRRKRLTEIEAQCYLSQTISALKYLHEHRVIHRDIKLGNLFLTDKMELKLGDFGLATKLEFDGERKRTICGTPNYIAPEVLDGKQGHSYEVDVWSLGVLAYTLLVGKPPFETSDVKTTYRRIKMNAYAFPDHVSVSDEAKSLISMMLTNDPAMRPTLDQVLEQSFFTKNVIPKLMQAGTLAIPPSSSYIKQFELPTQAIRGRPESAKMQSKTARSSSLTPTDNENGKTTTREGTATARGGSRGSSRERTPELGASGNTARKTACYSSYIPPDNGEGPQVWVKSWVDYSSKYGLGYLFSNSCVGVFFNDSTKIIADPAGSFFQYIHRTGRSRDEEITTYTLDTFPDELKKKVTLLQHFRKHLSKDEPSTKLDMTQPLIYVKKWLTTAHAILFRLSNKVVQVNFQDKTELILCSESKVVTYMNKLGERSVYPLNTAMESGNNEMTKRLRYTKEVLTNMLQPQQSAGTGEYRPPITDREII